MAPAKTGATLLVILKVGSMRRGWRVTLWFLVLGVTALAVESGEQPMTIVRADQKTRDRVVAWVVDTPIYQQESYFEVVVRTGGKQFQGQRDPENAFEMMPVFWKPGVKVQGRVQGHSLYLKRPNGVEMRFVIVKRSEAPAEDPR